jgi:Na+/phosphate symporter
MPPRHRAPLMPLAARLRVVRILWVSLTLSTVLVAGVFFFLLTQGGIHPKAPPQQETFYGIAGVAALVAVLSLVFPKVLYRTAARLVYDEAKDRTREALLSALLPVFQTPFIMSMALSESVSIFGLTLGMMGFPPEQCAPFFAVGTALALGRFPSEAVILGPTEDVAR